ncbi:hypothetical protein AAFC00_006459 [Neodothiora populina]|uniref:Exocyst complex component SEC5 n=1 Tax=Neodothiora populina TaxID=2781224 RepID=A0ABR3P590_9PEZI
MAAEIERQLLNHYKLDSLYPAEWPQRDDDSDADDNDDDDDNNINNNNRKNKSIAPDDAARSRFAGLNHRASVRSTITGTQKSASGADSLVQKDEPDPLGLAPSVVQKLRRRGLPVEEDLRLRNRFLLSSTTFSPTLFLSQVHQDASTESLLRGLDTLSQSIEQKSASLKVLVESNFERFVRAKATIDNVYQEMRNQGQDPSAPSSPALAHRRQASRVTSRNNTHFRSVSGTVNHLKPTEGDKRKNALTKESEYGVLGIKAPLIELAVKAEEVWGPALGGRDKEEDLKGVLSYVEQNRPIFCIAGNLQEAVKTRDYEALIEEYNRAKRYADQARSLAENASDTGAELTDAQVHQILVAAKIWHDTRNQVKLFKRDAWKQLANAQTFQSTQSAEEQRDSQMTLIGTLLQLGVDENPIWYYLNSRYNQLKERLNNAFERMKIEVEVARRKLGSEPEPSMQVAKVHLQSPSLHLIQDRLKTMDTPRVLDFWEKVQSALNSLLAVQGGLFGEILDFWETAQSFISGKAQRELPNGVFTSESAQQHLELADDEIARLQNSAAELITTMRDNAFSFFADSPIDDISSLFSPVPATPDTPTMALSPPSKETRRFSFDVTNIPGPSPKKGESWEKYAFWPPYANSLSGAHYLARFIILVGTAASEASALSIVSENPRLMDKLKSMVVGVRERCVQAVCAAWAADSDTCKLLEDWTRSADRRDLTNMPSHFMSFEEIILQNLQRMMFISEAVQRSGSVNVIAPPSSKLLQVVRHQFVSSMYKALSGTVENAEKHKPESSSGNDDPDGLTNPAATLLQAGSNVAAVDASNKSIRVLLSLSNLSHLRKITIPHLLSTFETSFSVSLNEEQKTLRDVLAQIDNRLFQSYTSPTDTRLANLITSGINDDMSAAMAAPTTRPTNARPYIYEVLLTLVLIHAEITTTTPPLAPQILSHHLETISSTFLSSFKSSTGGSNPHQKSYNLYALMQATLDVELVAQTLSNYTTERASDLQSQIYLALDERTDADARRRLQGELPEMRAILKRLREGTKGEFGCFKRERRSARGGDREGKGGDRPGSSGKTA